MCLVDHLGQRTVLLMGEITLKCPQGVGWQSFLDPGLLKIPSTITSSQCYVTPGFRWLPGAPGLYHCSNTFSGM